MATIQILTAYLIVNFWPLARRICVVGIEPA
jgi:hypothetical protein